MLHGEYLCFKPPAHPIGERPRQLRIYSNLGKHNARQTSLTSLLRELVLKILLKDKRLRHTSLCAPCLTIGTRSTSMPLVAPPPNTRTWGLVSVLSYWKGAQPRET